jgi:hypothetical protein
MEELLEHLLVGLDEAFGDLTIPAPEFLTIYPNGGSEAAALRDQFGSRHWRDISPEEIAGEPDILSFLTPTGYQFLLPAVLRATLVDPVRADVLCDYVLWSLAPPDESSVWEAKGETLIGTARKLGVSERTVQELVPTANSAVEADRIVRLVLLTDLQKAWLVDYVRFLRAARPDRFTFRELERVEHILQQELTNQKGSR